MTTLGAVAPPSLWPRSVRAVLAGLVVNVVLALGIDQILHVLNVYPPWGQPMPDAGDNALALGYRIAIGVISGYVTARLAPHSPVRHAIILGAIGLLLSVAGIFFAASAQMGPMWYPVALAVTALPTTWLGGLVFERRRPS